MERLRRVAVALGLGVALTVGLFAQQDFRGAIEGAVKDNGGGIIPGVTVTATLIAQNKTHTAVTNDSGAYNFSLLEPGTYRLKATMPGFKSYERSEIVLQVGDKLTLDITLTVGDISQEIVVRGDTTPLTQQIATFDQAVDERQIEDLPLNGRNSYLLFGMAAGVFPEGDPTALRPFDNENTSNLTVGGTGSRGAEFSLDGGTNTGGTGRITFIPSTEAVKEFKVTTSAFDASVGNTTGPIINAGIRSGTKQYRGSLYEFHRNSALDANFWDSNRQNTPLPSAKWNQFGGTFGGPLPFVSRGGKSRTFFFINYEGMRQDRVNFPFRRTLPTELERAGDFSQTVYRAGDGSYRPVTLYDPLTTYCANCDADGNPPEDPNRPGQRVARTYRRQPFPGNRIPRDRMNPVALQLLRFIPLANKPGDPITGQNNFIRVGAETENYNQWIGRIDHTISERQNLFISFSLSGRDHRLPNWLGNIASPDLNLQDRFSRRFVIGDTYTFSQGLVMDAQLAVTRYIDSNHQASIGVDLAASGFTPGFIAKIHEAFHDPKGSAFPDIDIPGYIRLGTAGDHIKANVANDAHEARLNFTKIIGKHGLRWGTDGRLVRRNEYGLGLPSGRLSFGKNFTHGPNPSQAQTGASGNNFAAFLLGYPTGGYIEERTTFAIQDPYLGAYIQDDWKLSGRLTLNLGLRWEYWFPRTERFDRMTRGFAFDKESPIADAVQARIGDILANDEGTLSAEVRDVLSQLALKGGLLYAGRDGAARGQLNSRPFLFAPRVGFAYRLSNKTVVRGGMGLFFEPLTRVGNPPQDGFNARTGYVATETTNLEGPRPAHSLSDPFPDDLVKPYGFSRGLLTNMGQGLGFVNPERTAPRVHRAEFGIQRELPGRIGVNANYLFTRWRGRPVDLDINDIPDTYLAYGGDFLSQPTPNPFRGIIPNNSALGRDATITLSQLVRPYPQFYGITTSFNRGWAHYNGFNLNVTRRFHRGYMFQAAYTLAKTLTATNYANVDDRRRNHLDRRLLDDDRPQRLVINGIWELPFGRGKRFLVDGWASKLLGGWQVSGIGTLMAGRPIHFGGNRDHAVATGISAKLEDGPYYDARIARWVWFNRDAFRPRRPEELRNVPNNLPDVRVQGIQTIDLRLTRNVAVTERLRMQFIAETFNLTNRVQFGGPETDVRNVNFGTTAHQVNLPRSFQFALKLTF